MNPAPEILRSPLRQGQERGLLQLRGDSPALAGCQDPDGGAYACCHQRFLNMKSTAHVDENVHGKVLEVHLHGRLSRKDYERLIPETERLIRIYGKIRIFLTMRDFCGWDAGALWEDLVWNARHFHQIERLAIVREKRFEMFPSGAFDLQLRREAPSRRHWVTGLRRQFANTQVRYFTPERLDTAYAWVNEFEGREPLRPIFPLIS
jgi:SpoIIAA-like